MRLAGPQVERRRHDRVLDNSSSTDAQAGHRTATSAVAARLAGRGAGSGRWRRWVQRPAGG